MILNFVALLWKLSTATFFLAAIFPPVLYYTLSRRNFLLSRPIILTTTSSCPHSRCGNWIYMLASRWGDLLLWVKPGGTESQYVANKMRMSHGQPQWLTIDRYFLTWDRNQNTATRQKCRPRTKREWYKQTWSTALLGQIKGVATSSGQEWTYRKEIPNNLRIHRFSTWNAFSQINHDWPTPLLLEWRLSHNTWLSLSIFFLKENNNAAINQLAAHRMGNYLSRRNLHGMVSAA